jgi:hypothetical protein
VSRKALSIGIVFFVVAVILPFLRPAIVHAAPAVVDLANNCSHDSRAGECVTCINGGKAWTALGCISSDFSDLTKTLLDFGIGISGGVAFLLILLGGFQIMTSGGNPEQLEAGKELVSSAITGLILIIFSVFILRLIGVDILGIPNLSK